MNYVQKRILVVGVILFSLGLLIVPWTSPQGILVRPGRMGSRPFSAAGSRVFFSYSEVDPPQYVHSGYCLIFAMPEGASIGFGRIWPPLAVVVMGTALGLYLAHGQDRRTPY